MLYILGFFFCTDLIENPPKKLQWITQIRHKNPEQQKIHTASSNSQNIEALDDSVAAATKYG